jgi:pimeloyl-ACP methyl ester carboxylesterase
MGDAQSQDACYAHGMKPKHVMAAMLVVSIAAGTMLETGCVAQPRNTVTSSEREADTAQANGITLAYESFGSPDRETVLLIGGTGQQLIDWPIELVNELVNRGYRVVRFDNRDVGLSTKMAAAGLPDSEAITKALLEGRPAPIPYTLQDMADDAVGLLDALEIEEAHIVGISMGGAIAQFVAIGHPTRTLSLTSIAADSGNPALPVVAKPEAFANLPPPPPPGDKAAFIAYQVKVMAALGSPGYPTDEATRHEWVRRSVGRAYYPDGFARQQTVSLVGHLESGGYRLNNLKRITAPTVVLHGADDPLVPVESARDIAARVPNADLRIVPGMGHDIPVALVETVADAIAAAAARAKPA